MEFAAHQPEIPPCRVDQAELASSEPQQPLSHEGRRVGALPALHRTDIDAAQFGRLRLREPAGAEAQRVQVLVVRAAAGDRLYAAQARGGRGTPCRIRRLGGFGGIR